MTRIRMPHNFHEVKKFNPETFCKNCGTATPSVCEWCGACYVCHEGATAEERF